MHPGDDNMISFIRNLVGVKTDQAVQGAMEALVRWDPKAATEAELRTMEQHLDQLGRQVAEARQAYDRERREAEAIARLSDQRMAAAEQLESRAQADADPARKSELERSLATLVGMLEQMAPDLDREKQDAEDAGSFLNMLEEAYNQAGQKLKSARDALNRAQRDMGRAEQQREVAERRAEAARQAAGLSSATSGLSVALKAMQDNAARNLAVAEAANAKARLLQPTRPEQDDPNIAAAMTAASGARPASTSLADRLAALRQKQPAGVPRQLSGPDGA
jgi:DNA repair exonuclease SbcCD ATPase subunit